MARRKIEIEYIRDVVGHPKAGTVLKVERTEMVDALIGQGIVVNLGDDDADVPVELDQGEQQNASGPAEPNGDEDERPADGGDHNGPADPPTDPNADVAPDGSTAVPAKKTPAKKTARQRG
ncbi:hypothetical protein [uncultured Jatrophihabitans sp.]|uniref:hypothetical protein n=1 Tax=uncultured Jatrophihabitans sp. TaxID=1610747 RepID=UPI0035CA8953